MRVSVTRAADKMTLENYLLKKKAQSFIVDEARKKMRIFFNILNDFYHLISLPNLYSKAK